MAKPDLDDGYLKVAHELDAALACAGFGRDERIVLHEVFEMIFGPAKLKAFDLSPSLIGERYGLPKQAISRAVSSLVESGVVARVGLMFRFIKDYEQWTWKGKPMLTTAMIRACRKAPKRAVVAVIKSVDESTDTKSSNSLTNKSITSSDLMTNKQSPCMDVNEFDDAASTNLMTKNGSTHSVEPARLREKEERKRACARSLGPQDSGRQGAEHDLFVKVVDELRDYEPTAFLAESLINAAETPDIRNLPSWRLFVACRMVQRPDKSKTWGLFRHIAQTCTKADYDRVQRTPAANGEAKPKLFANIQGPT